ncbi:hypothetical protein ANN_03146 [Periplaneta americana]|uniref:PiggyBac transposable element-derived protein domain-containing protein n=1 Tax=Periplaneta americana TaxID=6978 RepID=A0ABQ8TY71_PERAM|nr:hypothetical protein ANN_03146 [Periplaneta americana]
MDEDVKQPNDDSLNLYGKNACKWSATEPNRNRRTPAHNIVMKVPTLKGKAKNLGNSCNPLQAWECLFTDDIITEIVIHTNEKISSYRANFSDTTRAELRDTNAVELRALFGFLYYTAVFKSNHESLESMFATDGTGRDIFRAILPVRRTYISIYSLRFDDFAT